MTGGRSCVLRPYGVRGVVLIAAGAAVFGLVSTMWVFLPSFAAWDLRDVTRRLRAGLSWWAILIGWLAVFLMRVHSSGSVLVGPAPSRPRSAIVSRQMVLSGAAVASGCMFGCLPAAVTVGVTQYATVTDWLSLVSIAVSLASLVPLGACFALLLGYRTSLLAVPAALIVVVIGPVFVIQEHLLVNQPVSIVSVAYAWSTLIPPLGHSLRWQIEMLRITFFVLVFFAATKAAAGLAEWRAARRNTSLLAGAWLAVPGITMVAIGFIQPILYLPDPADQVRCREDGGITLCLYQIDEPRRDFILGTLQPLVRVLSPAHSLTFTQEASEDGLPVPRLRASRDDWIKVTVRSVSLMMMDSADDGAHCNAASYENAIRSDSVTAQVFRRAGEHADNPSVQAIYNELAAERRTDPVADEKLIGLSGEEFRLWYLQHRSRIARCDLALEDLPG